jgi:predicted RNA-binding protein associated with RNAse of E/G family
MLNHPFQPGQTVLLRELWGQRVRSIRPYIVVQDSPVLMAFYMPQHTVWKESTEKDRLRSEWKLKDTESMIIALRLAIPKTGYSVLYFRNADGSPICWYINLEEPLCRTEYGFEYTDLLLDIIASPDLSTWRWDDEDELSDAVNLGQVSSEKAAALYTEGKKAIEWLQSGNSPFNEWVNWSPDSSWQVPVIPEGWGML